MYLYLHLPSPNVQCFFLNIVITCTDYFPYSPLTSSILYFVLIADSEEFLNLEIDLSSVGSESQDEMHVSFPEESDCGDNSDHFSDSDKESDSESSSLPILDILNRFCFKLKEEATISSKATERIRTLAISLLKATNSQSKNQVYKILQNYGIDHNRMPELEDVFSPSTWEHGAIELTDSSDFGTCFPNISPKEIKLGKRRAWKSLKNGKRRIMKHRECFYYVSLLASLEVLLNNQIILDMVAEPRNEDQQSSLLCDFNDGSIMNNHELFSTDPHSLKIILYYDDLEITNQQTKRKHKLAMFYFQLGNLYSEYRSKLKSINLLAIVENEYLKKYGMDAILKPFIDELKILGGDMGYDFQLQNGIVRLRGALFAVIADTPASQLLGGYKESVGGAKRKCRHCMADFDEMQEKFREEDFELRDKDMHDYHLQQMEENPELHTHFSKEYGVNKRSVLLDAPFFDVTAQLPQDLMHIILEGALSRALFFVITYFINNNAFTLNDLNAFILNFNYGYAELKDKPVYISPDDLRNPHENLGQTAAQIWLLSRVFVYFAEPFAHQYPDVYKVLLTILEVTAICLSKKISINILGYLKVIIEEHLQLFKNVLKENITPKQHYLIHLPSQILQFGPLVRAWAMRFEAKHQQFKQIPKITKNFRNLPKTLSERHQSGVRADSISLSGEDNPSDHPLFRKDYVCRGGSTCAKALELHERDAAKNCIMRFYPLFEKEEDTIFQATSVTVHGTCYKRVPNTIILAEMNDSNPVFGSLENIWLCGAFVFLGLKLYETVGFTANLNSYQIQEEGLPSGLFVIEVQDLLMTSVMHGYKHDGKIYICPREDPKTLVND